MTSLCRRVLNHVALDVQDDRAADGETVSATVDVTVNSVTVRWMAQLPVEPQSKVSMTTTLTSPKGGQAEMSSAATVSAGPDGVVSGVSRFHFLLPSQEYILSLYAEGSPEPLLRRSTTTERCGKNLPFQMALMVPSEMWMTYVGVEHDLGPEDMVWTVKPSFELMRELWRHGCFTLPSPGSLVTQCPNPISRYCLDLKQQQPWLRSKKVKRHRGDFRLTVNGDYRRTFKECEKVHLENHRSTWITPELVEGLDRCRREAADLKVYSIELWEKSTGTLAAAIMGLSMGDVFHDYTMATMLRDDRSPGAILTKVVGHLLVEAGYTLWYWGYKNPYMAEYDGRYGGVALNNEKDFWPRWQNAMNLAGAGQLGFQVCPDLAQRVPSKGLDLALDL